MKYIIFAPAFFGIIVFPYSALAIETIPLEIKGRSIPENSISTTLPTGIKETSVMYPTTATRTEAKFVEPSLAPTIPIVADIDGDTKVSAPSPIVQYNETNLEFIKKVVPPAVPPPASPTPIRDNANTSDASAGKGAERTLGDPDFDLLDISMKNDHLKKIRLEATEGDVTAKVGVQGWDPKKKEEIIAHPEAVNSAPELTVYVEAVALNDTHISDIRVTKDVVEIESIEKGKLFWFIPIELTRAVVVQVTEGTSDRVKVKFPWYHVFVKKSEASSGLTEEVLAGLNSAEWQKIDNSQSITDASRISHTLQVVSGILKTKHDTVKNSISNVR